MDIPTCGLLCLTTYPRCDPPVPIFVKVGKQGAYNSGVGGWFDFWMTDFIGIVIMLCWCIDGCANNWVMKLCQLVSPCYNKKTGRRARKDGEDWEMIRAAEAAIIPSIFTQLRNRCCCHCQNMSPHAVLFLVTHSITRTFHNSFYPPLYIPPTHPIFNNLFTRDVMSFI